MAVSSNTALTGSVISSTQSAVDNNRNSFATGGQLTTTDLQNTASFNASSSGTTVGVGTELGKSGAGVGNKDGQASSSSTSGISGIAGNTAVRTGDASTGIQPIFDLDKVRADVNAQVQITTSFGQQASKAIGDYAGQKLKDAEANPNKDQSEIDKWKEGGAARVALHTLAGLLTGNLGGALGAGASQLIIPNLDAQLGALDLPPLLRQTLLQAAGAAIGDALSGSAGAAAGLNATANNYLRHDEALLRAQLTSKLQTCKPNECTTIRAQINEINRIDQWRDQQLEQVCKNPSSADCVGLNMEQLGSVSN